MKKLALTTAFTALLTCSLHAQGTVLLANYVSGSVNAKITEADGVTGITGPPWSAGLLAGNTTSSLIFVGSPVLFLTGAGAGYIPATTEVLPGITPGSTAYVRFVVWNSDLYATFAQAQASGGWGASQILQVATGGAGSPPSVPAPMIGLTGFSVPEPSAFALVCLALFVATIVGNGRHRKNPRVDTNPTEVSLLLKH